MQSEVDLSAIIYDGLNRWGDDDDFFLALANERPHSRILDLGCGTGRLTIALASAGHEVTGVDPDEASLRAAQAKPGAEAVTWIHGKSDSLPKAAFDLALLTSHVAQAIVDDKEWHATLADLRQALLPGSRLVFDSRDPNARAWESWTPEETSGEVTLPGGEMARVWVAVQRVTRAYVTLEEHTLFIQSQKEQVSAATLRFRTEAELRSSLSDAGFYVEQIFGGWQREAAGNGKGELIVLARASEERGGAVYSRG